MVRKSNISLVNTVSVLEDKSYDSLRKWFILHTQDPEVIFSFELQTKILLLQN